ncbi:YtxH domain-containing protein [Paenibacillus alba]|uniref:YtxH domain-containing protein n=1 Tax=Paenibacillus alba TaxID=1197127 RepID=A0ABU6FW14_9BACL|nr:YtxH domain-containing protein [Paenibacillus alba]MEC0225930.1 YtxH domain-containing protein [Paenibacillus alba]NQX70173.1 YtxH domain-containing protein [Paenibacillus alba]
MSEAVGTNKGGLLLGLVIGGAVGAVASLLFAPKAGSELREDLSNTYRTLNDKTSKLASTVGQKTQEIVSSVCETTQDIAATASEKAKDIVSTVSEKSQEIGSKASDVIDKAKESKQLVAESLHAATSNSSHGSNNNQH